MLLLYPVILTSLVYYTGSRNTLKQADAIVVLGASQWNGKPSPVFKARLDGALWLYQQNYAPFIITTGGIGERETLSEAEVGKNYLTNKGVETEDLLLENQGKTSQQSLSAVARLYQSQGINNIILVSDSFHIFRLRKMAHDLGFTVSAFPAPDSPIKSQKLVELRHALREVVVFTVYLALGF
jgi:uncharacterized SAM-binding protein YcdF (DUF218 family)